MKYYQIVLIFALVHVHNFVFCSQKSGSPLKSCLKKTSAYQEVSEDNLPYQLQYEFTARIDSLENMKKNGKFSPCSITAIEQAREQSSSKVLNLHAYFKRMEEAANTRRIEQQQRMNAVKSPAAVGSSGDQHDGVPAVLLLQTQTVAAHSRTS